MGAPEDFESDELSVIVIVPEQKDTDFKEKYRRLFSHLNRYAKPTDQATNIIMDEDDIFAILTRRLISENTFFKSAGKQSESRHIKTQKGKNLKTGDSYFTSLEALYEMNIELLHSQQRADRWLGRKRRESKNFQTVPSRPTNTLINSMLNWRRIGRHYSVKFLTYIEDPTQMRTHALPDRRDDDQTDHLLFWPIGQQMLAELVRVAT